MNAIDWRMNSKSSVKKNPSPLEKALSPSSHRYYSELNPSFISHTKQLKSLNKSKVILARDGIIPLMWFFINHPSPAGCDSTILIHKDCSHVVPLAWRNQTKSYVIDSINDKSGNEDPKRILIYGLGFESQAPIPLIQNLRHKLKSDVQIDCHFPLRKDPSTLEDREEYPLEAIQAISNIFGKHPTALSWFKFGYEDSLRGVAILELNERTFIADCFLTQSLLSRGAYFLKSQTPLPSQERVNLSSSHYVDISGPITTPYFLSNESDLEAASKQAEYLQSFQQKFYPRLKEKPLYPYWFLAWAKSMLKT